MAGYLYTLQQQRLIDNNGLASGGSMYFYHTGTSVLATIYVDQALTIPLANPVVVDAAASIPSIFLDPATVYRCRIVYPDGFVDDTDPVDEVSLQLSLFEQELASPAGASLVEGVAPSGATTNLQRHIVRNYLEDISGFVEGSGGNPTTNSTLLNAAIASQVVYSMRPGALYNIGSKINIPSNSGLVFEGGGTAPTIYMPSGNFNNTALGGATRYANNAVGIDLSGQKSGSYIANDKQILAGFILQSAVSDGRVLTGINAQNCSNIEMSSLELLGFPLAIGIRAASIRGKSLLENIFCHTFTTNSTIWLSADAPQITGIEIDNDQVNGIGTEELAITNCRSVDLTMGAAALAAYGYQTDGFNIAKNTARLIQFIGNLARNIGEGLDCFGSDCQITNFTAEDAYIYGLKLIHGASRNSVANYNLVRCGLAGLVIAGSNFTTTPTQGNIIGVGNISDIDNNGVYAANSTACVSLTDGPATTMARPYDNQINGATLNPGANGKYHFLNNCTGADNYGLNLTLIPGPNVSREILVTAGGGAVSIAPRLALFTDLMPVALQPPANVATVSTATFVPSLFQTILRVTRTSTGTCAITLPPQWAGRIIDAGGNASVNNITINRTPAASGTGSITTTDGIYVMTTTAVTGTIYPGQAVTGTSVTAGTHVMRQLTGTTGGIGTYQVNVASSAGSTALTFAAEGNINGSASATINTNYGSANLIAYDLGAGWGL